MQEPVQGASDLALRPSMASPTRILAGPSEVLVSQTVRDLVAGRVSPSRTSASTKNGIPRPLAPLPGGERARLTERADAVAGRR